jgi:hypothetical protein
MEGETKIGMRVLTVVYNILDQWDSELRPSSGILKTTTFRTQDLFPSSGEEVGDTYSVGSVFWSSN